MGTRVAAGLGMAIVAAAVACGGKTSGAGQPQGPPALASWSYVGVDGPVPGGTSVLVDQCLAPPLPLGGDGDPDCVFIRAVYPHGTAAADAVAACQACSDPGEAPVPASIPLSSMPASIDGYDCLCVVLAQPPASPCPPVGGFTSASPAAWCYAPSEPRCADAGAATAIEFSPAASVGSVLYGACFAPGTIAVSYAQ
jgi:hypothetical protein